LRWPFSEINLELQNLRIKEGFHADSFIHELDKVVGEKIGIGVVILVLNDVINHEIDGSDLVIIESLVDG